MFFKLNNMTRTWKNLCLIALLSMLQSIAPLVHAHVSGDFHSSGIHLHSGNIQLQLNGGITGHDHAAPTQPELRKFQAESPAIGMTQGYKNEYVFFLTDIHGSPPIEPPVSSQNPLSSIRAGQQQAPAHFTYSRPPAQAPPVFPG